MTKHYWKDSEQEMIENYDLARADNFKGWDCHHRLELHPDGSIRFTRKSLIDLDLYYDRPARELIYIKHREHWTLHGRSVALSEEVRRRISKSCKGRKAWNAGMKGMHLSAETKLKLSKAAKGRTHTEETRENISKSLKGRISPMKGKRLAEETKRKMSVAARKRYV